VSPPNLKLPQPTKDEISESGDGLREAAAIADNLDLASIKKKNQWNELDRTDSRERHIHRVSIWGIYIFAFCCFVMFIVLVSQYILPDKWRLLTDDEGSRLQAFLFSGLIGGVVTSVGRRFSRSPRQK
jgi:hypothetical protein